MKNFKINEKLKDLLKKEMGEITIGDCDRTTIIELKDQSDDLQNTLVALFNMCKINQYKIEDLENENRMLSSRIYDTDLELTDEEYEKVSDWISAMDFDEKENIDIKTLHEYIGDMLWLTDEENTPASINRRAELVMKLKYPTKRIVEQLNEIIKRELS